MIDCVTVFAGKLMSQLKEPCHMRSFICFIFLKEFFRSRKPTDTFFDQKKSISE